MKVAWILHSKPRYWEWKEVGIGPKSLWTTAHTRKNGKETFCGRKIPQEGASVYYGDDVPDYVEACRRCRFHD